MRKLHNKKGFTLAELLIVVAIIAVLVAIAIPVFTAQLEKARESTDAANIRASYAEAMAAYITDDQNTASGSTFTIKQQDTSKWDIDVDWPENMTEPTGLTTGSDYKVTVTPPAGTATEPTIAVVAATTTTNS